MTFDIGDFYEHLSRKSNFHCNSMKTLRTLHQDLRVLHIISSNKRSKMTDGMQCCVSMATMVLQACYNVMLYVNLHKHTVDPKL